MTTTEFVSQTRRTIRYLADFNGLVQHDETFAHSFSEVQSQLQDSFYNVRLINIQYMD